MAAGDAACPEYSLTNSSAPAGFGRFHPYVRFGYVDSDSNGPTFARRMVAAGIGVDNIFGQNQDQIVVGVSWVKLTDDSKNNQTGIDAIYRVQLTPQIQFGPTLGIVFDPVDNPDEGTVFVGGVRARIYL